MGYFLRNIVVYAIIAILIIIVYYAVRKMNKKK